MPIVLAPEAPSGPSVSHLRSRHPRLCGIAEAMSLRFWSAAPSLPFVLQRAHPGLLLQLCAATRARCVPRQRAAGSRCAPLGRSAQAQGSQSGQATTEYALVLLGAAAVALLLVAWATRTGAIGSLLDAVIASIRRKV